MNNFVYVPMILDYPERQSVNHCKPAVQERLLMHFYCEGAHTMAPTINPSSLDRFRDKPALLRRLIQIYLDSVPKMIADMQESAINQDTEKVSFLAHSIKGSSAEIGAEDLGEISQQLQLVAKDGNKDLIEPLMEDLADCFEETRLALQAFDTG